MQIEYKPPGRVASKFHLSNAFVRGLMGPVGSGKSSSCCVEVVSRALRQKAHNGVRSSRWAIIRNTYPELKSTTIKTWQSWFPEEVCQIRWDAPITAFMKIQDIGDGTALDLEVIFLALDRATETGKLRSLELTAAWVNESSEIPKEIFDMLTQRVGRFPAKKEGGPSYYGVILDTNPPDDDSWYYKIAEEDKPDKWEFFRQSGGLIKEEEGEEEVSYTPNPDAENVLNLPNGYNYYLDQVAGKTDDWINVFVLGNYGTTADGKPVYPEWKDKVHISKETLDPVEGLPVILGWDFGLTPACVVTQLTQRGQLLVLQEFVGEDMGIRQFASDVVKPAIMNEYYSNRVISVGDPAGATRAQTDERTCLQELYEVGIATEPADTNDWLPRRESVAFFMNRMIDGGPGFVLDPSCSMLRRGFNGRYRYQRIRAAGTERYKDRPVKDIYSHIQDAIQYACLKLRTGTQKAKARKVTHQSSQGWT